MLGDAGVGTSLGRGLVAGVFADGGLSVVLHVGGYGGVACFAHIH